MNWQGLRIGLAGPLPPPAGGMASQTQQLFDRLTDEGARVELVQTNAPYRPALLGRIRGVRALVRLLPYLRALWSVCARIDVLHVMANSGWSWHLFAAPAVWIARWRNVPVVVNYHGGEAEQFLQQAGRQVKSTMQQAQALVVPSGFLLDVFSRYGMTGRIVPNSIDLDCFHPAACPKPVAVVSPHIILARNLEAIYGIDTALHAFACVHARCPQARLSIAGTGPLQSTLEALVETLGLTQAVCFTGRLGREEMAQLYREADVMLNPSRVDNLPSSILESWASGVPVVSTNVGGIPFMAEDGRTALLVPADAAEAMGEAVLRVCSDPVLAEQLCEAGLAEVQRYRWGKVRAELLAVYGLACSGGVNADRTSTP